MSSQEQRRTGEMLRGECNVKVGTYRITHLHVKQHQRLLRTTRSWGGTWNRVSFRVPKKNQTCLTAWFQTSGLQNCELVHFFLKVPSFEQLAFLCVWFFFFYILQLWLNTKPCVWGKTEVNYFINNCLYLAINLGDWVGRSWVWFWLHDFGLSPFSWPSPVDLEFSTFPPK